MNEQPRQWDNQPEMWSIFNSSGVRTDLDNLSYLEHIYKRSRMLITSPLSPRDKSNIRLLIWDLEEIKEYSFFRSHIINIDNQIGSLKRILTCEKIHKYNLITCEKIHGYNPDNPESSYSRFNSAD